MTLRISPEVETALAEKMPVVALESTLIAHGLPSPKNIETALAAEDAVRSVGAIPATCAVIKGELRAGLSKEDIVRLAGPGVEKTGERDLAWLISRRATGSTTVSGTLAIAARAGIKLFATGGIGGIHRGGHLDVSADLYSLSRSQVAVVSSGVKSILDIDATLELLETLSVPVLGLGTNFFPRFYVASGPPVERRVEGPSDAAVFLHSHFDLLGASTGILLANPSPLMLDEKTHDEAVQRALDLAERENIRGKATTPFLLQIMRDLLGDAALEANSKLIINNAKTAAEIARAYAALRRAVVQGEH
jgi:pseudouridine-5'-phosphate glycosidase